MSNLSDLTAPPTHGHGAIEEMAERASELLLTGSAQAWALGLGFAFALGAIHALIPGHGKALLASRYALSDVPSASPMLGAAKDALTICLSRLAVTVAILLPLSALVGLTRVPEDVLIALIGAALVALGLWTILRAWRGQRAVEGRRNPLLFMGLLPEPMAALVISYAMLRGSLTAGLATGVAIAFGMALTLTFSAILALGVARRDAKTVSDNSRGLQVAAGVVTALAGLAVGFLH